MSNMVTKDGLEYKLLERSGQYALLEKSYKPTLQPYIVAIGFDEDLTGECSWEMALYFNDQQDACEVYAEYVNGNARAYLDYLGRALEKEKTAEAD